MKISICMATYNGEKYVKEQVDSILSQMKSTDELIISDDYSTDNTVAIIKKINDKRVRLVMNNGQKGYTKNFENALGHAEGERIFLADQDDIWLKNRILIMMKYLDDYDFVVSDAKIVNENLEVIHESRFKVFSVKRGFINNFVRTRYIGCNMAFNRKVLEVIMPFPEKYNYCPHDLWIALVSEFYFKTKLINQPLMLYRRHNSNTSSGGENEGRPLIDKLTGRIYCLAQIYKIRKKKKDIKG